MAQDLHDGVGHGLAVIAMQAGVALHVLDRDPAKARASLEAIRDTSRESLEALRSELAVMSGGAPRRPASGLAELPALLDRVRAAGLRVEVAGMPGEVSEMVGRGVVRGRPGGAHQRAAARRRRHGDDRVDPRGRPAWCWPCATTGEGARCRMRAWASAACARG